MSEFSNTWDYHRDFDIMHFGNPEAVQPDPETPKATQEEAVEHPKKKRFLNQPKGWFRR